MHYVGRLKRDYVDQESWDIAWCILSILWYVAAPLQKGAAQVDD